MNAAQRPQGVLLGQHLRTWEDEVGRGLFFPCSSAPLAVCRFDRFRADIANTVCAGSAGALLASLIAFDGVVTAADLPRAYAAARLARQWRTRPYIEWTADTGRTARRFLSVFSTRLVAQGHADAAYDEALAQLLALLTTRGDRTHLDRDPLAGLIDDAAAWFCVRLAGYLAAHVLGINPLASVPARVLAREASHLALAPESGGELAVQGLTSISRVLKSVAVGGAPQPVVEFRNSVVSCIIVDAGRPEYVSRRNSVKRLEDLACGQGRLTHIELMMVNFAIHLLTCGTPHSDIIAVSTARDYFYVASVPLLRVLPELLSSPEDVEVWTGGLSSALDAVEPGQRAKAGACVSAFLAFLADHGEAPKLIGSVSRGVFVEPPPRANLLHPAERAVVRIWLHVDRATRLGQQAEALFEGLSATGGRVGDILTLTLENTRVESAESALLVVDPLPTNDRKKRPASGREIALAVERCRVVLLEWKQRRIKEGAGPRDLLFGDPARPRLLWREHETRALLLTYVKAATGDTSVNLHTCRHTHITDELAKVPHGVGGEYLADIISSEHGHESTGTTRMHYDHGHEIPLRTALDALDQRIALSERAAAHWLGVAPGTVRKRWSRATVDQKAFVWAALKEQRARTAIPDVTMGVALAAPERPALGLLLPVPLSFDDVRAVLVDATAGHSLESIALRRDIAPSRVRDILLRGAGVAGRTLLASQMTGPLEILLDAVWSASSFAPDFSRIDQPKLQTLASYLETTRNVDLVAKATAAWRSCLRHDYISIEQPHLLIPLLELLATAKVAVDDLIIRVAPRPNDDPAAAARLRSAVRERAISALGSCPAIELCSERRGRPRAYLLFRSEGGEGSAALGMSGFHALLLAASVWSSLSESVRD